LRLQDVYQTLQYRIYENLPDNFQFPKSFEEALHPQKLDKRQEFLETLIYHKTRGVLGESNQVFLTQRLNRARKSRPNYSVGHRTYCPSAWDPLI